MVEEGARSTFRRRLGYVYALALCVILFFALRDVAREAASGHVTKTERENREK